MNDLWISVDKLYHVVPNTPVITQLGNGPEKAPFWDPCPRPMTASCHGFVWGYGAELAFASSWIVRMPNVLETTLW